MKKFQSLVSPAFLILISIFGTGCSRGPDVEVGSPPQTRIEVVADEWHGQKVEDPYRWLEDQDSPETREWIARQNAYTDSMMEQLPGQEELGELASRLLRIDSIGMPSERGGRYFFSKRKADEDLDVLYYREGLEGEDRVLIDPHPMSEDHTVSVGFAEISDDGKLVVYSIRKGGTDEVELRIRKVDTGEDLPDIMPTARYGRINLKNDNSGFFYATYGSDQPRILFHVLGQEPSSDEVVFEGDFGRQHILAASLSDDNRWMLVHAMRGSSGPTRMFLRNLESDTPFATIFDDGESRCFAQFAGNRLVIATNKDAPNSRIMAADPASPEFENWTELIPEQPDAVLQGISPAGGQLFLSYLKNVVPQVHIFDKEGMKIGEIQTETLGSTSLPCGEWDKNEAFFSFSSFHQPPVIYRYLVDRNERDVWARTEIPIDTRQMEVEQVRFASKDGTMIPMFVLHRKDIRLNGRNPALLTGYGGFRSSQTPRFSGTAAAWVQEGGVYALPALRGGAEFGEEWHRAGMLEKKQNVFDDFIAASEYLIAENYTRPEQLGIMGGSNGGLLVGAAVTQRPDLFGAVVCTYPLLDMLRYQKLLVGSFWISEYGSAENPDQFEYLRAYSPYHNVEEGVDYPPVLFITGDADTRVAPAHARKMTALMQAGNGSDNPILLRYHTEAGHSGGQPVEVRIEEMVELLSFLKWTLGVD